MSTNDAPALVPLSSDGSDAIRDIVTGLVPHDDAELIEGAVSRLVALIVPPERVAQALQLALRERQAISYLLGIGSSVNVVDAVDAVVKENHALRRKMGFSVKQGGKKRRR